MAKKGILKDKEGNNILPITRGELVLDSNGNQALHSNAFIATSDKAGLMSAEDKYKLDNFKIDVDLSECVTKDELKEVTDDITELNERIDNIPTNDVDLSDYVTKQQLSNLATKEELTTTKEELTTSINSVNTELSKKGTYSKPSAGIPKSDLSEEVLQEIQYIGSMEIVEPSIEEYPADGYEYELSIDTPNKYYKFKGRLTKLTLKKLPSTSTNYVTNVMIDFISGSGDSPSCKLEGLFNQIKWFNGIAPSIKENTRYQISIVDNLGVWACYE